MELTLTGNIQIGGNETVDSSRAFILNKPSFSAYTPGVSGHWVAPAPTTIAEAIDRLTAMIVGYTGSSIS